MRFIPILLAALAVGTLASPDDSMLAPSSDRGESIRKTHLQYLLTPSSVGWEQFDEIRRRQDWQSPEVNTLNLLDSGAVWVKLPLKPPPAGEADWRLEVQRPDTPRVELATWSPDRGLGEVQKAGRDLPLGESASVHKNIVLPIHLPQGSSTTVYLRIESGGFIHLPMVLFSADTHQRYSIIRLVVFSMVFGVMAVMILYNLSLYLAVRDRMYLFYSNAVFSSLLYLLAVSGYGRIVFWAGNEWLEGRASAIFAAYCFLSVTYFFRIFLDLPRYGGWVSKTNTAFLLGFAGVLVGTLTPLAGWAVALLGPISIISSFVGFAATVSVWRRGSASAKYFMLAWTGVSISTGFVVANLMGIVEYFPALEYSQAISFLAEIVLLSLALADRIRRQRLAKEQAQAELLQMQEQANSKLEAQVALRTRELEAAMVDLKSANRELSKLTKADPLTKVSNRRHFDEIGEMEVARAKRTGQPVAVVMVDIDHFKSINDAHGHVVGDKCLKLVAQCISQNVGRVADVVARYGGEEFALILPDTDQSDACILADRIRKAIANLTLTYDGKTVRMTASLGVSGRVPDPGDTLTTLVKDADKALYRAKESGRNRVMTEAAMLPAL
ncbi:diguanylate cyclase [Proteobacteria bacterium 005FR1]|nr:diguanylate cyclase [Proteobacteria bacterium 005FR1]